MTRSMADDGGEGPSSSAWMITPMDLSQILPIHVGVDLRGGDVHMPKHLLDRAEIGPPFQEVGGEGMSQRVGAHVPRDAGPLHMAAQDLPRPHTRERAAPRVEEEDPLALALLEPRPQLAEVDGHGADGGPPDGDESFLAALAEHAHQSVLEQYVANSERDPLGYAEAGAIRQLQQSPIAKHQRVVECRGCEQPLHLVHGEHFGEGAPALRRLEPLARIPDHHSVSREETK